jgi:hypothetical protein
MKRSFWIILVGIFLLICLFVLLFSISIQSNTKEGLEDSLTLVQPTTSPPITPEQLTQLIVILSNAAEPSATMVKQVTNVFPNEQNKYTNMLNTTNPDATKVTTFQINAASDYQTIFGSKYKFGNKPF